MPRLVVVAALVVVVLGGRGAPAAGAAQEEGGASSFAQATIWDVDGFWNRTFAAAAWEYASPEVVPVGEVALSACGQIPGWVIGAYRPLDRTIFFSVSLSEQLVAGGDDFAWTTVIAHEWAHHVQVLLGIPYGGYDSEQQADCLAGAYAPDREGRGLLSVGDVNEAVMLSVQSGDAAWLPEDAPGAHGSGAERAQAFLSGYRDGLAGCGLAT
jgi:predicted metalloprotease